MSKTDDRGKIAAALDQIAGEYRLAPATRNMLLIVAGMLVPLLLLIVVRLLSNLVAPLPAMMAGGLLGLVLLGGVADLLLGVVRISPAGIECHTLWPWRRWRTTVDEIAMLGSEQTSNGRHLLIERTGGRVFRLPFRPGFERVLPFLD